MKKLLFECWCVTFTKLRVYDDRVEIGNFFGLFNNVIPFSRLASVRNGFIHIEFETTGGGKIKVQPWVAKRKSEAAEIILNRLNKPSK